MRKVSDAVQVIISRKPFLESAMAEGLLNYNSLAKYLLPEVETFVNRKVQSGTIVMALRRMQLTADQIIAFHIRGVLNNLGDITVRSNLMDYTFQNSDTLIEKQLDLLELVKHKKDFFLTFSQGIYETAIVLSDSIEDHMDSIFKKEKLISKIVGLSSATIKLPIENIRIPGIYFHIFKLLAWEKINILEVISTTNEFTIVVENKDINRAFGVLMKMK